MSPPDARDAANADATPAQRQRSAALVGLLVVLAVAGALSRIPSTGTPPAPCAAPHVVDGVLRCDAAPDARGPAGARAWLTGAKLDVNTATARELEAIPNIGPSLAQAIVFERTRRGRFASMDDLDDVNGVGPKTLELLGGFVDVK